MLHSSKIRTSLKNSGQLPEKQKYSKPQITILGKAHELTLGQEQGPCSDHIGGRGPCS